MNKTLTLNDRLISVPLQDNLLLQQTQDVINGSEEIRTLWRILNVNAIDRLKMTDHGAVHFHIVANLGLRLLRLLVKSGVTPSIVHNYQLSQQHAEVVVFLGCVLHDVGMSINRLGHEELSIPLANSLLRELLNFLPITERTIIIAETLHAIISHRRNGQPLTIEAGVVRIADALDMSEGRSRIPYDAGEINIHSLSAKAIDNITIAAGAQTPIMITIHMNNSSGIFQVDELLKEKLAGSGLEKYFEITAKIKGATEKKLLSAFTVKA